MQWQKQKAGPYLYHWWPSGFADRLDVCGCVYVQSSFFFPYLPTTWNPSKPTQNHPKKKTNVHHHSSCCCVTKKKRWRVNKRPTAIQHTHTQIPSKLCSTYSAIVSNTSPIITLKQSPKNTRHNKITFLVSGHGAYTAVFHLHKLEYFRWSIRNCYSI